MKAQGAASPTTYAVIDNHVDLIQGKAAIIVKNTSNTIVAGNIVTIDNSMPNTFPVICGLKISDCNNCLIDLGNSVTGINGSSSYETRAISISSCNAPVVSCNKTDNATKLQYFNGPCASSIFVGNEMKDGDYGLYLTNSASIGSQFYNGNQWTGSYSSNGARAVGTTAPANSPFTVSGTGFTYPPNPNPSTNWFTVISGTDKGCNGNRVAMDSLYNSLLQITDLDYRIANDSDMSEDFTDAIKWTSKRFLYHKLSAHPSLWATDSIMISFMNTQDTTNIGKFYQMEKGILELPAVAYVQDSIIHALDSIQLEFYVEMFYLDSLLTEGGLDPSDSLLIAERNEELFTSIYTIDSINDSIQTVRNDIVHTRITELLDNNAAITVYEIYEQNEQRFNLIYLTVLQDERSEFTEDEIEDIYDVANQCALSGGVGVYKMRSLYNFVNNTTEFDDDALCSYSPRIAQADKQNSISDFVYVYPNPNNGDFMIQYKLNEDETAEVSILNTIGEKVFTKELIGASIIKQVNVRLPNLSSGIYFCNVKSSNHVIGKTFKFVISK